MKKILLIAVIILSMVFTGCVFNEKKPHGVNFVYSGISSIGYSGNQTGLQEIKWGINLTNTGDRAAESANASVNLHPEIASRLNGSYINSVMFADISPGFTYGINGTAVFNATGLSKQDILGLKPLVSVKLTWIEDGSRKEKVIGIS
jgi:hypothetical protein